MPRKTPAPLAPGSAAAASEPCGWSHVRMRRLRRSGLSRLPSAAVARLDYKAHSRDLLAFGDLLQEVINPLLEVGHRAGGAAAAQITEQVRAPHGDGDQALERGLNPLHQLGIELIG
jgi:hypothetical protein